MAEEQSSNPEPTSQCCEWKARYMKMKEGRNALRRSVKLLEKTTHEFKVENEQLMKAMQEEQERMKTEKLEKESNVRISLENEVSALKSEIAILKNKCCINDKEGGDGGVKSLLACISDKEIEINKFKQLWERETIISNIERKVAEEEKRSAAEAQKLLEVEKKKSKEERMVLYVLNTMLLCFSPTPLKLTSNKGKEQYKSKIQQPAHSYLSRPFG